MQDDVDYENGDSEVERPIDKEETQKLGDEGDDTEMRAQVSPNGSFREPKSVELTTQYPEYGNGNGTQ